MPCTPKNTLEQIIESGNDYLVTLKAHQGKLFKAVQLHFEQSEAIRVTTEVEPTRDRHVERTVTVLAPPAKIDPAWVGGQRVIQVERRGTRSGKPFEETLFYLSSFKLDAPEFAQRIRDHWQVENNLHWVKDVVLGEDKAPLCAGHALTNFAIVRTIAVNLFRLNGFASITKGLRAVAHDIHQLFSFLQ
ncbi:MAG: ISAs1 family transposase [Cyanobacteria bacterium RU_5_0]|nr:ISAs1 family transposase [Cyanobacteria bacterium RU_5_0]